MVSANIISLTNKELSLKGNPANNSNKPQADLIKFAKRKIFKKNVTTNCKINNIEILIKRNA